MPNCALLGVCRGDRRVAAWATAPAAAIAVLILTTIAKFLTQGPAPSFLEFIDSQPVWWLAGLILALYAALGAYLMSRANFRNRWAARKTLGQQAEELRQADLGVQNDASPEFAALWRATQARLDYYHQIATAQSKQSSSMASWPPWRASRSRSSRLWRQPFQRRRVPPWPPAITGVAGGGLGGYIGATFMRAQENSTVQLRAYFDQPLPASPEFWPPNASWIGLMTSTARSPSRTSSGRWSSCPLRMIHRPASPGAEPQVRPTAAKGPRSGVHP